METVDTDVALSSPRRATRPGLEVLGPIAATSTPGARLDLGGPRQRRCLAALAVDAGRAVPGDRLAERVWGERLPDDPRAALRTLVARLRQALGPGAVVTEGAGYRLDAGADGAIGAVTMDSLTFVDLVARADGAVLGTLERLELLDAALALWSGPAFDEVAGEPWARAEAERLDELRATATERRFEAMLAAGKHTDALVGLAGAVEAFPLRDRLVGQHMLALYRAGRQAEAARVFQAHRARLATDLGLEPGRELVELDRRIVAGDSTLNLAAGGSLPGRALRGYRLGEQLGEGAFAVVFRGTQPSVGRDVAVKVIRAELANRPEFVRRFEAEAHLVASLEHPHIVPLYDYWREPDRAYLIFRYLRGGTLEARLTTGRGLAIDEVRTLVTQVGAALGAAHRAGVVHRDVKPANVFLDEAGNFYLGDFGIALEGAELADPAAALSAGSPAYASPEQLRREPVGPQADVHGLGVTVYEALTGELPFPAAITRADLLQRQLNEPIPAVRSRRQDIPPALDAVLARATAKSPEDRFEHIEDFVAAFVAVLDGGVRPAAPARRAVSTMMATLEARNPYKGLRAFTEADAVDFRGRTRLVDRLLANLSRQDTTGRVTMVVGPSGIGKSSVVRAGLLPALRRGAVPGSERWFVATMLPGREPFEELGAALLRLATKAPENLMSQLVEDQRGLARVLKAILPDAGDGTVLLLIDQFEELFTLCEDDVVRRHFLDALEYAVTDARCPLRLVATIRADFYDRPLRHGSFARLIEPSTIAVTALAPDELEAAIVEPAVAVGCEFEPGLVSEIVADVGDQPGALPLLQYALTELYERRVSELLTRDAYRELGGVAGALARRAEELTEAATEEERDALRRVFGRLVVLGEGTEDTRRRVVMSELGDDEATKAVIERFGAARLLSFDRDPASREPTVEVAHEALIRQWPRLRGWLEGDRDGLRVQRHLIEAAHGWDRSGRDDGELYRGARLELALDWLRGHQADPNPLEREFLETARAAADGARRRDVRARRRLRRAFVAVAVVAALAMLAGALAFQQRGTARDTAFTAETGRLAALAPTLTETDLSLSMLLGVEAVRRADTPESLGALQRTFVAADTSLGFLFTDEPLRAVHVDGDRIIGFGESTIVRWDANTHERVDVIPLGTPVRDRGPLGTHPVSYVNGIVAWVGNDDVARVMDLAAPGNVQTVAGSSVSVALDPTATRLAVALQGGGLTLVDRASLRPAWELPGDGIATMGQSGLTFDREGILPGLAPLSVDTWPSQVTFTADGATVIHSRAGWLNWVEAGTGTRHGRVQSVYQPAPESAPDRITNAFKAFAFDQGGRRVFVSALGAFRAYDVASMAVSTQFEPAQRGASGFNTAIQPLPDGTVAILRAGGELNVVDPDARVEVSTSIDTRVGRGSGLALAPDGTTMLVAGERGVALIAIDGSGLIRQATAFPADRPTLAATRDAAWVGADGFNGIGTEQHTPPQFWQCTPGGPCTPGEPVPWVDNTTLYADPWSNTWVRFNLDRMPLGLQLLDAPTGAPVSPVLELEGVFGGSVAIAADRSWVMINRTDQAEVGKLQVHALPSGDRIATLDVEPGVLAVAMPPLEDVLLWFNPTNGRSFLVDVGTWAQRPSPLGDGEVAAAAYSQDGRWLVTADTAGDLVVRDPRTFREIRRMSSEGASSRGGFVFSDDGRHLVSNQDGKGRLWDVESGQLIGRPIEGAPTVSSASFPGQPAGFVTANDTFIQVWRFDPSTWADIACKAAGRNLTRAEWDQYGPRDRDYRATCPQWPAAA